MICWRIDPFGLAQVEIGEKIIAESGLDLYPINDLNKAAEKAVELAKAA